MRLRQKHLSSSIPSRAGRIKLSLHWSEIKNRSAGSGISIRRVYFARSRRNRQALKEQPKREMESNYAVEKVYMRARMQRDLRRSLTCRKTKDCRNDRPLGRPGPVTEHFYTLLTLESKLAATMRSHRVNKNAHFSFPSKTKLLIYLLFVSWRGW